MTRKNDPIMDEAGPTRRFPEALQSRPIAGVSVCLKAVKIVAKPRTRRRLAIAGAR